MKKTLALLLCLAMALSFALTCASAEGVINLYTFTDEVPRMIERYKELHPEFDYTINLTQIATTDGLYQPALDQALMAGGADAPDLYCAESAFVLRYTQGDMAEFAAAYADLGIDVEAAIKAADIAQYSVDIGTRPSDGQVVGLGYQATGGAFIYRRSLALDTWGTDDPAEIAKKIGPGWDQFFKAAAELKEKGYGIVSGDGDIWHAVENSSEKGWIVDGELYIDPAREAFLDLAKELMDNGYHNDTRDWNDAWFADFKGIGEQPIFGFFGPAWLINYVMAKNCGGEKIGEGTYGDWAVCEPPIGFFWGGT
ncbi:MAG: carbohydrate ABC transporter substrate-binding protein, partial [Firmicutes bacterium]|nr:carbohydrate ABC transporter substrate-binding protein [Bacillota bacterium]